MDENVRGLKNIRELSGNVCQKISTAQVITSLANACRELIDNSLDSNATNIEIRVVENGTEVLEISDNGTGIDPSDFDQLCKPHSTSKLKELDHFNSLMTFGFRGEALNALAALSDVQITTKNANSRSATRLVFGRNGEIVSREQCPRAQGTTVSVSSLFKHLPVRRQEFLRQARREFLRLVDCVQAFALCRPDCRFSCSNAINGKRSHILSSPGGVNTQLLTVMNSLFGLSARSPKDGAKGDGFLSIRDCDVPNEECCQMFGVGEPKHAIYAQIKLSGYISSCEPGSGRSSADRQFVFVNRRHIDFPKLCRIANEVYGLYNRGQYCTLIAFIEVPPSKLDVNISPDKRTVFMHHEKELFAKFRASLLATFAHLQTQYPMSKQPTNKNSRRRQLANILQEGQQMGEERLNVPRLEVKRESREEKNCSFIPGTRKGVDLANLAFPENGEEPPADSSMNSIATNESTDDFGGIVGDEQGILQMEGHKGPMDDDTEAVESGGAHSPNSELIFAMSSDEECEAEMSCCESIFRPGESPNLRDSLILAETPIDNNNSIHSPAAIVRMANGFVSASTLLRSATLKNLSNRQNQSEEPHFRTAAKLLSEESESNSEKRTQAKKTGQVEGLGNSAAAVGRTPTTSRRQSTTSAQKTLQAFSFECLRPGGMEAVLKEHRNRRNEVVSVGESGGEKSAKVGPEAVDAADGGDERNRQDGTPTNWSNQQQRETTSSSVLLPSTPFHYRPQQTLHVDLGELKRTFECDRKRRSCGGGEQRKDKDFRVVANEADAEGDREEIERRLSLMLSKNEFLRMQVVGQFNNAFVVVRLDDHVFIVDQHAADEKYNFERLQTSARIQSQRLINPQQLELGPLSGKLLRDNLEVFRANGFDFEFPSRMETDDEIGVVGEEPPSAENVGGVSLTSVPVLNGWQFDKHDVDELLSMVEEMPGVMHRPSKLRKIFASNACRRSVMFGRALGMREMEQIIRHMSTMDNPWSCPHGRPTIRFLCTVEKEKP